MRADGIQVASYKQVSQRSMSEYSGPEGS
jgi:hypothetical protein